MPSSKNFDEILEVFSKAGCAAQRSLALYRGKKEPAVSHETRQTPNRSPARAVAATRPSMIHVALTTLILSVLLGLLSGAAWMQLT
jgi:hypothetical protein